MNTHQKVDDNTATLMLGIGRAARSAARILAVASTEQKNAALIAAAKALRTTTPAILAANAKDIAAAKSADRPASFIDRLLLDEKRVDAIAKGLEDIAALADPVGTVLAEWTPPQRSQVPARARAFGSHRHHLRDPPERHRRRGRAQPQSR